MELILLKIKLFFQKIYTFIKLHWDSILFFFAFLYTLKVAKNKEEQIKTLTEEREKRIKEHNDSMDSLQKSIEEEIKKRQEIQKQYDDLMKKIKNDYEDGVIQIAEEKKKEIREIIQRNHGNPSAAAEAINNLFGIKIIEMKEIE